MSCQYIFVKPLKGVVPMPENDYRCMPAEGACVPNNSYYRQLINHGNLVQVSEQKMDRAGSYSHVFKGSQMIGAGDLLLKSGAGNTGVFSIDIDVRTSELGVVLTRGNGVDTLNRGDSRDWQGAVDSGYYSRATEFGLLLNEGDEVVINWVELKKMPDPCGNCMPCQDQGVTGYDIASVTGRLRLSTSQRFKGPRVITLISLLQHSQAGNMGIHSVDIDVIATMDGVLLRRGQGVDLLAERDSRDWHGATLNQEMLGSATDFELVLQPGDEVVINWTEIR